MAIRCQNDDLGREHVRGFRKAPGGRAKDMIVAGAACDVTSPAIDPLLVKLAGPGARVFCDVTVDKFVSQSLRKMSGPGWRPLHCLAGIPVASCWSTRSCD
ncbi:hypothetical protein ACFFJB_11675 [Camelimonas abortus]|uniref:Uncharacterized protein n=1 Tax=Camelimonas abortus TaxID=1017184 RepID=A0ABV7LF67_9HYPH